MFLGLSLLFSGKRLMTFSISTITGEPRFASIRYVFFGHSVSTRPDLPPGSARLRRSSAERTVLDMMRALLSWG